MRVHVVLKDSDRGIVGNAHGLMINHEEGKKTRHILTNFKYKNNLIRFMTTRSLFMGRFTVF